MNRDIYQALISDAAQGRAAMSGFLLFAAGLAACGSRWEGEAMPGGQVFMPQVLAVPLFPTSEMQPLVDMAKIYNS
ncbi:hypothetical protein [Pannonibacter phragmitetus]|uniref:hypothetical protein n=1 Tax=Pannonibacter phragmitetus TaxID=121719 RepID=UPI003D2EBBE4